LIHSFSFHSVWASFNDLYTEHATLFQILSVIICLIRDWSLFLSLLISLIYNDSGKLIVFWYLYTLFGQYWGTECSCLYMSCFCSVDDWFPNVTFHFENSVILNVYPHEYLFPFVSISLQKFILLWFCSSLAHLLFLFF
jgi:hypothetical protein